MPELTWIGKDKVVNHHHDVPFRILEKQYTFGDEGSGNKIIHGDNLAALKSLLPEYEGRIKCIYIDPPYNTGNEGWVYNDNVNDPKLKRWLNQVVGKEGEDLSRHDKWLCMMYPRLKLLRRLLSDDGVISVSIDDNDVAKLRILLEEIFGAANFVANILWQKRTSPDSRLKLSDAHEHIICFAKRNDLLTFNKIPQTPKQLANFKNPDNDPRGPWASTDFSAQGFRPNQMYEVVTPSGRVVTPPPGNCLKKTEDVFLGLVADNRFWFGRNGDGVPRRKTFLAESEGVAAWSWWTNEEVGHSQEAKQEVKEILSDSEIVFDTPKPSRLIERIIQIATKPDAIILDSFAGSGTTAHAVLKLNAADGANRKFILIEREDYAETITAERVRRVMNGYGEGTKAVAGLGGSFDYYEIGEPLFHEDGNLNEDIGVEEIRKYVAYTENLTAENQLPIENEHSPYFLGKQDDTAYIFYYEKDRATTLDLDYLSRLNFRSANMVFYAGICLLNKKHGAAR
ncbi:MAG: site-specific DNA-methyltransferase [Pyrinomonadaceae bacterium]